MHDDGFFDDEVAATYDDADGISAPEVVDPAVNLLAEFAGGGRVLGFAIGTGRLAVPLVRKGVEVERHQAVASDGVSPSRQRRRRGHSGGDRRHGDNPCREALLLVYLAFDTINYLTSQEAQVACFLNAAAHLEPGGRFLIEVGVPPLQRLPLGETILAFDRSETHWGVDE